MATLFDDVGKAGSDHVKNVFPSGKNNFEAETTAKTSCGAKIVFIAKRNADGSIAGTFKPSSAFTAGDVKGEWKGQFGTDSASKVDTTFTFAALSGFKLKAGTNDTTLNVGADYVSGTVATNLKVNYPFRDPKKAPSVEAAGNYVHGCYSLGAKILYPLDAPPSYEGKAGVACGKECSLLLSGKKTEKNTSFALGYFHELTKTRTLASSVSFAPGSGATFLGGVGVVLSTSNQVTPETLVKARFDTDRSALAFGLVQTLNKNVSVELGTDFPANFAGNSVYNLKFLYKA
jgi:hypothetical protein